MCRDQDIPGMSKKRKDVIIDAILKANRTTTKAASSGRKKAGHMAALATQAGVEQVTKADFQMSSVLTHPSKKPGDRCTTAIRVSCGANSGKFPVTGKTVGAVGEFLREVLNVDRLAEGIVNGDKVDGAYVLKDGDDLEFLKPAGRKG